MSVKVEYADDIPILTYSKQLDSDGEDSSSNTGAPPPATRPSTDVGFTFIDWSKSSTIHVHSISSKWIVLIASSLLVGYITTVLDLTAVWMNDLKKGYCFSKIDKWSLLSPYSTCPPDDWHNWSQIFFGFTGVTSNVFINLPIYTVFAVAFTIGACIVSKRAPEIIRSGIPEINLIISGLDHQVSTYLGLRTLIYKTAGLVLVVSSGLWLGKEGPLVHVSCCILNLIFNLVYRANDASSEADKEFVRRELLSAAAATGISVAFNAPIGGVLFVLESIQSYFIPTKLMWNSFISATVAVIVLTSFKIFTDGENFLEKDLFSVEFGNFSWLFMEFVPFTMLGAIGGVYGFLFTKLNSIYAERGIRTKVQRLLCKILNISHAEYGKSLEVIVVLIVTIILNFPLEITRLPLQAYLKILFTDCPEEDEKGGDANVGGVSFICNVSNTYNSFKLLFILVQGFLLSSYTFGLHLPGGVLMPSLALGATAGRLVGIISQSIQNGLGWGLTEECTKNSCLVSPSSYAVVGAASFMSGVTKLTMCVVVIIFELTGAVSYVLPIMIAVTVSKFVNDWLCNDNVYDQWLKLEFNKLPSNSSPTSVPIANLGKGSGLCTYSNSTSIVKNKLPNVETSRVMIPVEKVKCIELVKPYLVGDLKAQFIEGDNHEGYPVIGSYQNPVIFGYIKKTHLQEQIDSIHTQDDSVEVTFELSNGRKLPNSVISDQLRHLQSQSGLQNQYQDREERRIIYINPEVSLIILTEETPIVSLIEIFEKLHLNYGIIMKSITRNNTTRAGEDQTMSGFVDRFLIANLINSEFAKLVEEEHFIGSEYDIENMSIDDSDDLLERERHRESLELIS